MQRRPGRPTSWSQLHASHVGQLCTRTSQSVLVKNSLHCFLVSAVKSVALIIRFSLQFLMCISNLDRRNFSCEMYLYNIYTLFLVIFNL